MTDDNERLRLADLRSANIARQKEWDAGNQLSLAYRGNELAGEVGEACNVIKKLERERLGIAGSRDTVAHLAEELADVVICADLIAMHEGIDLLGEAVPAKFNATSEKVGLKTRYEPALRASSPVKAGGVVVRPLKWEESRGNCEGQTVWSSGDPWVFWIVKNTDSRYVWCENFNIEGWRPASPVRGTFENLDAAKAAAQADYETRIHSALVVEPVKAGETPDPFCYYHSHFQHDEQFSRQQLTAHDIESGWLEVPLYAATPDTSASVGLREALADIATISACVAVVENPTSHVTMLANINTIATEALKALAAANQSDGGINLVQGAESASGAHVVDRTGGANPPTGSTPPAPQAVEAVSVDDRERDYIRHGLREEDLP